ncbi:MAG TPA: hypothetical protein VGX23_02490 [Actinocrinis sp.]|nr:hypothetical protein [Actinocrinis sp.]
MWYPPKISPSKTISTTTQKAGQAHPSDLGLLPSARSLRSLRRRYFEP